MLRTSPRIAAPANTSAVSIIQPAKRDRGSASGCAKTTPSGVRRRSVLVWLIGSQGIPRGRLGTASFASGAGARPVSGRGTLYSAAAPEELWRATPGLAAAVGDRP